MSQNGTVGKINKLFNKTQGVPPEPPPPPPPIPRKDNKRIKNINVLILRSYETGTATTDFLITTKDESGNLKVLDRASNYTDLIMFLGEILDCKISMEESPAEYIYQNF